MELLYTIYCTLGIPLVMHTKSTINFSRVPKDESLLLANL